MFKINKEKITMNELFSGVGMQRMGIQNTNLFDLSVTTTSDIDKEAVVSYATIHCGLTTEMINTYNTYPTREEMANYLSSINLGYDPQKNKSYDWLKLSKRKSKDIEKYYLACKLSNNVGDISKVEKLPYADLWTYSFPCTDISVAGKMKGLSPDKNTRSSLLWQVVRLLGVAKDNNELPKFLMLENVKNLVSKKFVNEFNTLIELLNELGFNSYWQVLNAKKCGIPQNRERVFMISIRKDIDKGTMDFPKPFDNGLRLKDVLEPKVDEKYYLSEEIQSRFQLTDESLTENIVGTTKPDFRTIGQRDLVFNVGGIMGALVTTDYKQPKQIYEKMIPMDKSLKNTRYGIEYANCICAREDCGVTLNYSQQGTAVLEILQENQNE